MTVFKSLTNLVIVTGDFFWHKQVATPLVLLSLGVMTGGAILASWNDIEFSWVAVVKRVMRKYRYVLLRVFRTLGETNYCLQLARVWLPRNWFSQTLKYQAINNWFHPHHRFVFFRFTFFLLLWYVVRVIIHARRQLLLFAFIFWVATPRVLASLPCQSGYSLAHFRAIFCLWFVKCDFLLVVQVFLLVCGFLDLRCKSFSVPVCIRCVCTCGHFYFSCVSEVDILLQ